MCRSIKVLRRPESFATDDEIEAAARQFVRKISGFHNPAKRNEAVYESAIDDIALVSRRLLEELRDIAEAGPRLTARPRAGA